MCLFCEIIDGKIPSTKVYEDDMILAFKDINPVAPVHIVIVPKVHIDCANGVNEENSKYVAHIFEKIPEMFSSLPRSLSCRGIGRGGTEIRIRPRGCSRHKQHGIGTAVLPGMAAA